MGIRDMFNHKYPITNLHEVDLTFMHEDIDRMISILESWESIIDELRAGLEQLPIINGRLNALESLTSGLNQAYADIKALKNQTAANTSAIHKIRLEMDDLIVSWGDFIDDIKVYVDSNISHEKHEREIADIGLDLKIKTLEFQVYDDIQILYMLIRMLSI